jgi:hypothetical protein
LSGTGHRYADRPTRRPMARDDELPEKGSTIGVR